jgi:hypothetical protein
MDHIRKLLEGAAELPRGDTYIHVKYANGVATVIKELATPNVFTTNDTICVHATPSAISTAFMDMIANTFTTVVLAGTITITADKVDVLYAMADVISVEASMWRETMITNVMNVLDSLRAPAITNEWQPSSYNTSQTIDILAAPSPPNIGDQFVMVTPTEIPLVDSIVIQMPPITQSKQSLINNEPPTPFGSVNTTIKPANKHQYEVLKMILDEMIVLHEIHFDMSARDKFVSESSLILQVLAKCRKHNVIPAPQNCIIIEMMSQYPQAIRAVKIINDEAIAGFTLN